MYFIGQEHIMYDLGDLLSYLHDTRTGAAILFRGPSGYGKTELAKKCCNFLVGREYEMCLGDSLTFNPDIWVHFIDEVHNLDKPEILYPDIDGGKYVFIFATNFDSILPEALSNRCVNYLFTEYTDEELIMIVRMNTDLKFSDNVAKYLIQVSGRNPRILIKTYIRGLILHFRGNPDAVLGMRDEDIIAVIDKRFGIINGLDKISREYIRVLENIGGKGSITLIASILRLDQNTIKYTVEPNLINKGIVKISSKGRELC